MAFNNNIPQPDDRVRDSQTDLLANFQALQAFLEVNHILGTFDSPVAGNTGKHSTVVMPENGGNPATAANEGAIYVDEGPISTVSELFFRRENNGNARAITEWRNYTPGGDDGYVYYTGNPGPFTNLPVIFATSFSAPDNGELYSVSISARTLTSFTCRVRVNTGVLGGNNPAVNNSIFWIAIGTI